MQPARPETSVLDNVASDSGIVIDRLGDRGRQQDCRAALLERPTSVGPAMLAQRSADVCADVARTRSETT
jgi:hypothetical protein